MSIVRKARFGTAPASPRNQAARRQQGIGLIELVVFIVVVAIAVSGILAVMSSTTAASADPVVRKQLVAVAEGLLEEIVAQPFTWCDPDDANFLSAAGPGDCAISAEGIGPETGETRSGPSFFDNVNDYQGFAMNGIRGPDGSAVAGLGDLSATVAVSQDGASFGLAAAAALKIDVTVTGRGEVYVLTGYRFRHSPNAGG